MSKLISPALLVEAGIATICLNRPEQGNAIDLATAHGLLRAINELHSISDRRAVVLTSTGRLFCAGGDVREMAVAGDRESFLPDLASTMHDALISLRALPVPILAAVQGTAAGAGVGLVLAADFAIASDRAKFIAAYGELGVSPDCGVSALLPAVIGPRRAALFTMADLALDAYTALDWGLVSECCAAEDLGNRGQRSHRPARHAARPGSRSYRAAAAPRSIARLWRPP